MDKLNTKRTIVVEGRYDAIKLNAITDATIIVLDGFAIYSDKQKQQLLKRLAQKDGLILLLDSDGAGFRMRHYITNLVGEKHILQVYTPAVKGKEKRKDVAGKEGLLGVEGIDKTTLYQLLQTAIDNDSKTLPQTQLSSKSNEQDTAQTQTDTTKEPLTTKLVTYTDLFHWGLSGTQGSAARKTAFLQALGLPPRLSKKELINVLNRLYTYQELEEKQKAMFE